MQKARADKFDAVITDIVTPKMDGISLIMMRDREILVRIETKQKEEMFSFSKEVSRGSERAKEGNRKAQKQTICRISP